MSESKEQTILLTIFSIPRKDFELCNFIECLRRSGTEWVEGLTVTPTNKKGKYDLERHFAGHPNGTHGTVQVVENQLWTKEHAWLVEGALQSKEISYSRARIKAAPSYLAKRNSRIPLEEKDVDVRYTPQPSVRELR